MYDKGRREVKSNMKQIVIGVIAVALSGCVPGEATVKISAENVRRVLKGEVVEVPVHGEVEASKSLSAWMREQRCNVCHGQCWVTTNAAIVTNAVIVESKKMRAATRVMTLLLADGSCVTGGVKIIGEDVVHWATIETKFLFGTVDAILAVSNKVEESNGIFILNDKGEFDMIIEGYKNLNFEIFKKPKRICETLEAVSKGCEWCKDIYGELGLILFFGAYESFSVIIEGDEQGGFCVETGDQRVAADKLGKEYKCVIRTKDSGKDKDNTIKLKKME